MRHSASGLWLALVSRCLLVILSTDVNPPLSGAGTADFDTIKQLRALINSIDSNSTLGEEFEHHFETWGKLNTTPSVPRFDCSPRSGARSRLRPTSVHQLRPGDIDVVAAIGDSITAGCGASAKTAVGLLLEWRGLSWSIGGDGSIDGGMYTLPNMLKKFNPELKGYSTGITPVLTQDIFTRKSRFNMAVSGAKSKNILTQAHKLVSRMKGDSTIDFEADWKLVTLFIGGNDLCAFCKDEKAYSVGVYQDNLAQTLSYLQDHLPRTLVNVVPMLDLTQLTETNDGVICNILHHLFCKCGSFPASKNAKQVLIEETVEYSESILDLLEKEKSYDRGENFTVVAQPFLINQRLPTDKAGAPDLSYFAPDCFHFSTKGHALSAQALWNNMFEPAGRKRLSWFKDEKWNCPTSENPFIYTYRNSDGKSAQEVGSSGTLLQNLSEDTRLLQNAQSGGYSSGGERRFVAEIFEYRLKGSTYARPSPLVLGLFAVFALLAFLLLVILARQRKQIGVSSVLRSGADWEKSALY